ncbi:MAG: ubiquitin-like domain-containing protein [Thermoanaerobacterales bacterium]|nr:ubiquitin-like domain-containing protein [Thermoanaerobacterales bacterium]
MKRVRPRGVSGRRRYPERRTLLPRALALAALLVMLVGLAGWAWAKKNVTVTDGDRSWRVVTYRDTVAGVLAECGLRLGPHDTVSPAPEEKLRDGARIRVLRAVPVAVRVDGQTRRLLTAAGSVGEVLRGCGITLGRYDFVEPDSVSPVRAGMTIKVTRVDLRVEERRVPVPYRVVRRPDGHLARGLYQVIRPGRTGEELQRWEIVCHDGEPVHERLVDRRTLSAPRHQVVAMGVAGTVSRGGRIIHFREARDMRATAYTYTGNNCATGVAPAPGIVAVDPQVIPLGTGLYIEGYGYARAMDTGGAVKGQTVDVFFTTRDAALQWGVRQVRVYVLE